MDEEDYMSASFIESAVPQNQEPVRGRGRGKIPQRKPPEKIKSFKELESESIRQGLASAISQDNKGFKMLKMMGYKEGTGMLSSHFHHFARKHTRRHTQAHASTRRNTRHTQAHAITRRHTQEHQAHTQAHASSHSIIENLCTNIQ
jgi:hypothetical protein